MDEKNAHQIIEGELRRRAEDCLSENRRKTPLVGVEEDQKAFHELQVHQIELEMQNAELLQSRGKLEATLERYNNLFDFAPVGYLTLNHEGTIQAVNFAGASLLGLARSKLLGWRFGLFVTAEYRSGFTDFLDMVFTSKDRKTCEVTLLNDGNVQIFVQIVAIYDDQGQECLLTLIDISERKRAEQRLQESERIYRAIGETIDYGIWICAPDGRNIYASNSFLRLVGITQEQCSNFGWGEVLHPDDSERTIHTWKECVHAGCNWDIEHRFRGADGQWHHILARGVPVRDDHGNITCWAGINLDISRFKEVEKNLRESEERHRLLAETMLQGVVHQDANGTIISMNPAAEKILGKSPGEFLGNTSVKVEHETIRENGKSFPGMEHPTMVALQTGQPVQGVVMGVFNPKRDEYRWININAVPVFYLDDTSPSEVYAVFEDITERKQEQEYLRQQEERLRLALEAAKMAAWDWDVLSGNVIWNDMHYRMMGYEPGEVQPSYQAWASRIHPDDIDAVQRKIQECMAGGHVYAAEFRTMWPDGSIRWLEARGKIEYNANNEQQRFYGVMLDITQRKQSEETQKKLNEELENRVEERTAELRMKDELLIMQSRQAAMGEMIGNIAHQWRQPLNVLGLNIQQLLLYYDIGGFTREFLDQSVSKSMEVILHMSKTIDDFRNYFKPDKERAEFKLSEAVLKTLSLIEDSFKNQNISIEVLSKDEPVICGYENEFAQVILVILNNARDVFIEKGIKAPKVRITIGYENGRAAITITDNAGGIPVDIMDKIFDPYFTTKGPQTGTGVGLYMSKAIIEKNMNGRLTAHNTADGAEFRIEV